MSITMHNWIFIVTVSGCGFGNRSAPKAVSETTADRIDRKVGAIYLLSLVDCVAAFAAESCSSSSFMADSSLAKPCPQLIAMPPN